MTPYSLIVSLVFILIVIVVVGGIKWALREFETPEPLRKVLWAVTIVFAIIAIILILLYAVGIGLHFPLTPQP